MFRSFRRCTVRFDLITLVIALSFSGAFAQGGGGTCSYCFCVSDAGCVSWDCQTNPVPAGCTSQSFTAPCSGVYHFVSKVVCTGASACDDCSVCVNLFKASDPSTSIADIHNSHCDWGECYWNSTVSLSGGTEYIMRVCLTHCPNSNCGECGADCKGYGCVYRNVTTECVPF